MGMLGKIVGGMAGFMMGGPIGAAVGAAVGHAADSGAMQGGMQTALREALQTAGDGLRLTGGDPLLSQLRLASFLGRREQVFSIAVVVLAARVAKCDGPVNRAEIDAFKRAVRVPPEAARDIARLFDQAREQVKDAEPYAAAVAQAFAADPSAREDLLSILFSIARADGAINEAERAFLDRTRATLGLDGTSWDRARGAAPPRPAAGSPDPYATLGLKRSASDTELRATWKRLMREYHPDSLAGRGVSESVSARSGEKVAAINAAWDQIKRERGL